MERRSTEKRTRRAVLALALSCVFAVALSTGTAFAATKIVLSNGDNVPNEVFVGKTYRLKTDNRKAHFFSNNVNIARVGMRSGELVPKSPGRVKITAKGIESGKAVATKTMKVFQRAKTVKLSQDVAYLKEPVKDSPADTVTVSAAVTPKNSTDILRFASDNKEVATVDAKSGKVTAKGLGSCTITVCAKANDKVSNKDKGNVKATMTVYVGPQLMSAENDADLVFAKFKIVPDVASARDFRLVHVRTTERDTAIKNVKIEGDTVTLESSEQLYYGEVYKLTYGTKTVEFTAAEPKIASIRLTSLPVIGVATPISVQFLSLPRAMFSTS